MCRNMLLDGSVLWSLCFERPMCLCKPCRRCGARRVSAAVKRSRRRRRSAVALSLLLLLPLLGIAVAVPGAAAVLLAPLLLASVIRCWFLNVAVCAWQAWGRCIVFRQGHAFQYVDCISDTRARCWFHARFVLYTVLAWLNFDRNRSFCLMLLSKSMFGFVLGQAMLWQAVESLGIWHPLWRQEVCVLFTRNYRLVFKSRNQ